MTTNQTWQPIETAPKDGTHIMAYQSEEKFPQAIVWVNYEEWSGFIYSDENMADWVPEPTHWMPLPQPPLDNQKD